MNSTRTNVGRATCGLVCVLLLETTSFLATAANSGAVRPMSVPLAPGDAVTGTVALPGQQDRFTWTATLGQRLFFDSLQPTSAFLRIRFTAPSGADVFRDQNADTDTGPFYVTETGECTLTLYAWDDASGGYSFRLLDTAQAAVLTLGSMVSGVLDPPAKANLYKFDGIAGQQLVLESVSASHADAYWSLVSPGNATLTGAQITASPGQVVLPQSGSYLLLVQGNANAVAPLNYQVRVSLVSQPTGAPAGFQQYSGTLGGGETETQTLTAPAGTLVYFDSLDPTYTPLTVDLRAPGGALVSSFLPYSDTGPVLLPSSGDYTLEIRSQDPGSGGTYDFQILNLSSQAAVLVPGTTYTGSLPPYATRPYRWNGQAGQRLVLDILENSEGWVGTTLVAPSGSQLLAWTWGGSLDPAPITLNEPGSHLLLLNSSSDFPQNFGFRLLDVAQSPASALTLGVPVSGNLNTAYQTDVYRFNAVQGKHLFVDGQSAHQDVHWSLYGPVNQILAGSSLSGDWELTAPQTGSYVFLLASEIESPSAYQAQVIAADITSQPLSLGTVIDANVIQIGQQLCYTFNADAGTSFYYDALDPLPASGLLNVRLVGPGRAPAGPGLWNAYYDTGPFFVTEPGTYTLCLGGDTDTLGSVRFRLVRLDQPPAATLPLNALVQGVIDPPTESDCFTFAGTQGQRLFFDSQNVAAQGSWVLYGPGGAYVNSAYLSSDLPITLLNSGTFTLVLSGGSSAPVNYSFQLTTPAQPVGALTLGAPVSGSLTEPGQQILFTFTGAVGQRLYFDGLDTSPLDLPVTLNGPGGSWVFSTTTSGDAGPVTLREAGVYALAVGGTSDVLGPYHFRLSDLASSTIMGSNVSALLTPSNGSDLYRFDGLRGQQVSCESISSSSSDATWTLVGPRDQVLASGGITTDLPPVVLPQDATYLVVVAGYGDGSGSISYQLQRTVTNPSGVPSGFGSVEQGTLAAGQEQSFTFTAPAGRLVFFDSQEPNAGALIAELVGPGSEIVFSTGAAYDAGPYVLPNSGTYTLTLRGADVSASGDYRFRFLDLQSSSTPLAPGTVVSRTLDAPCQSEFFRFNATSGQRFLYDALTTPWLNSAAVTVWHSDGTYAQGGQYATAHYDVGPFSITTPGEYFLEFTSAELGPVEVQFRILEVSQAPSATLAWNEVKSGTLNPGYQAQLYQVSVSGQRRLFGHGSGADINANWILYDPQGNSLAYQSATADFEVPLTQDGSYLVLVTGGVADPVPFTIQISEPLVSTQAIALDTITSSTLAGPGEEHHYTFTGNTGQVLYYDALQADLPNAQMTLIAPSGKLLLAGSPYYDQGAILLTETGQYDLAQKNLGFPPVSYRFRLLDLGNKPILTTDSIFTGSIDAGYGTQLFQLEARAGWRYFFDAQGSSGDGYWTLSTPQGLYAAGNGVTADFEATAVQDGTLVLAITSTSADSLPYAFQIVPGNHAPVLGSIGNRTVNELTTLNFTVTATDTEAPNDRLTFSLDPGAPPGAAIDPTTGIFSWSPTEAQGPGDYPLTIRVTDDGLPPLDDAETITVTVREVNLPPVLTVPANQVLDEQTTLTVTNSATDPDLPANALTFALVSGPSGMSVDPVTGRLTWTPSENQGPTTNLVAVKVTDSSPDAVNAQQLSVTNSFTVTVREVNLPPVLTVPANQVLDEQTTLTVTNSATDPDLPANVLTFALVSGPSGMSVDPATGKLTWTPSENQGPTTNLVAIKVTDSSPDAVNAQQLSVTNSFTVTVREVNLPPVLTVPANLTLHAGQLLQTSAPATDPDWPANLLSYAFVTAPLGASIDPQTGAIQWPTTAADANTTNQISIRVTDNGSPQLSATAGFTVTVVGELKADRPLIAGSALTLSWAAAPGQTYRVQYKDDLSQPQWIDLPGDVLATGSVASKQDLQIDNSRIRFYRITLVP